MVTIHHLNSDEAHAAIPGLTDLLIDSVNHGASVGFMPPLSLEEAEAYWQSRIRAVHSEDAVLLIAKEDAHIVGSGQLGLEKRANGNHRAEVQKVLVHTAYRRRGIALSLMNTLQAAAQQANLSLLILDTEQGSAAEQLYRKMGYIQAGVIPQYARSADGQLHSTVFFYKLLT